MKFQIERKPWTTQELERLSNTSNKHQQRMKAAELKRNYHIGGYHGIRSITLMADQTVAIIFDDDDTLTIENSEEQLMKLEYERIVFDTTGRKYERGLDGVKSITKMTGIANDVTALIRYADGDEREIVVRTEDKNND